MIISLQIKNLREEEAFLLVDEVFEFEDLALSASAFEQEKNSWTFQALCESEPNMELFNKIAYDILQKRVEFCLEKIDENFDFVSHSLKNLQPIIAGKFYIYASHNKQKIPDKLTAIKIEASQAFGTGHHETTFSCLEAIEEYISNNNPAKILDLGTGSGILAIAVAKRLNKQIWASDNDETAIEIAKRNLAENKVSDLVNIVKAEGFEHESLKNNAPFNLVIANILADPLIKLAKYMDKYCAKNCALILSGILSEQAANIITAYQHFGFNLERRFNRGEWVSLLMVREG